MALIRIFTFLDLIAALTALGCARWLFTEYLEHWRAERAHAFPDAVQSRLYVVACLVALAWLAAGWVTP